jgi:hypothetical protein
VPREHVEFVRRGFEVVGRAFEAYWREPRSSPSLEDAEDLGGNQVLVTVTFAGQTKDGPRMSGGFFAVFTLRNNRVLRVDEYTTRAEALAAVAQLQG